MVHEFIDKLGLEILDEPSGQQSDPTLLHMKLRSMTTQSGRITSAPPPSIVKTPKDIDKWIIEVQNIHANQPYPMITHNKQQQDIDVLMTEWPSEMERILNTIGFPNASLKCSLKFYIELVCSLFDIPIASESLNNNQSDYLLALYTLFTLFMAIKQTN